MPVLRVSLGSAERRRRGCAGDGVDGAEQVADRCGGQIEGRSRSRDDVTAGARECDGLAVDGEAVGGRDRWRQCAQLGGRRRSTARIAAPVTVLLVKAEGVPRRSSAVAPVTAAAVTFDFVE